MSIKNKTRMNTCIRLNNMVSQSHYHRNDARNYRETSAYLQLGVAVVIRKTWVALRSVVVGEL